MFKIPHNKSITVIINDHGIAPVIAKALPAPFAYVAYNTSGISHARAILDNQDIYVTSREQLDTQIPVLPKPATFTLGQKIDVKTFIGKAVDFGYMRTPRIESIGEVSLRGDIADIWSPDMPHPVRIMFLGDEIEEIKIIDPNNFSMLDSVAKCILPPIAERCRVESTVTVLENLKHDYPIIVKEELTKVKIWLDPQKPFKSMQEIEIKTAPIANFFSNYSVLVPELLWNIKTRGKTVIIYVGNSRALERYLDTKGIPFHITDPDNISQNKINIIRKQLGVSFELTEHNTAIYSVGTPKSINPEDVQTKVSSQDRTTNEAPPAVGVLVVHEKHGLGRYLGKKEMALGDVKREYLVLQYDGGAFVYLPANQSHLIYEYIGPPQRLDRI